MKTTVLQSNIYEIKDDNNGVLVTSNISKDASRKDERICITITTSGAYNYNFYCAKGDLTQMSKLLNELAKQIGE